jgi:hypothetical protein
VFRWQAGKGCRKDPGSLLKQTADRQGTIKKVGKSYWEATFLRASGNDEVAPQAVIHDSSDTEQQ